MTKEEAVKEVQDFLKSNMGKAIPIYTRNAVEKALVELIIAATKEKMQEVDNGANYNQSTINREGCGESKREVSVEDTDGTA